MTKPKYLVTLLLGIPVWFISCFNSSKVTSSSEHNSTQSTLNMDSFYDIKALSLDGDSISMSDYKGKKIVILNVASKCGYTPQYADWQAYYEGNKDKVVVLGFPCNQFLGQEPGSAEEIETFCQKNYGVTFPMFEKIDVKGEQQSPLYQWLTKPESNGWNSDEPSWNFCKYLIDENGKLTHFFASIITPDAPEFISAMK